MTVGNELNVKDGCITGEMNETEFRRCDSMKNVAWDSQHKNNMKSVDKCYKLA